MLRSYAIDLISDAQLGHARVIKNTPSHIGHGFFVTLFNKGGKRDTTEVAGGVRLSRHIGGDMRQLMV